MKTVAKYGEFMADLTEICTQVWNHPKIEDKRNLLLRACETFKYKEQGERVKRSILSSKSAADLDRIAANLSLNKDNKVVGLLKR